MLFINRFNKFNNLLKMSSNPDIEYILIIFQKIIILYHKTHIIYFIIFNPNEIL